MLEMLEALLDNTAVKLVISCKKLSLKKKISMKIKVLSNLSFWKNIVYSSLALWTVALWFIKEIRIVNSKWYETLDNLILSLLVLELRLDIAFWPLEVKMGALTSGTFKNCLFKQS